MARYTISQLAQAADVPTTTLRYYERAGLLKPEDRSQGNYRLYSDDSLRRLKFIRAAQAIGFTLGDVKQLMDDNNGKPLACCDVQPLIEDRLAEIDRRLNDLRHVQLVLQTALTKCRTSARAGRCPVIETLRNHS
ncbi:MAG: MerR family transcriptional regulator [Bdellovibrionales bacterium]|nr:MerR family transcriptional regulator [Bdellovibrionales bacterium]